MQWMCHDGFRYLQFAGMAGLQGFFHAIALRDVTLPAGGRRSFNLGLGCGTPDNDVWLNRRRLLNTWGNPTGIFARQVHGDQVGVWSGGPARHPDQHTVRLDGDALVTDQPESALVIQVADCQPVLVADPVHRVVANIHSGWRGSIRNIIGASIAALSANYGSRSSDLVAGIGPSLGPCCAEFVNYRTEIPEAYWPYRRPNDRFDFWQMSVDQLIHAGLKANNIHLAGICTQCNPHLFFSYRADRQTGRFASVIGIRAKAI